VNDSTPPCPLIDYIGNVTNVTGGESADSNGNVYTNVIIKLTDINPQSGTGYNYAPNSSICLLFLVTAKGNRFVYVGTTTATAALCITSGSETTAEETDLNLNTADNCAGGSAGLIAAEDICLGSFDPTKKPPIWNCIEPTYQQRVAAPVWDQSWGTMATQVMGQQTQYVTGQTYALLNIPLPPPVLVNPEGESWWAKYGKIVLGVTISMFILLLILAYAISRLIRYREKYLVEKRDAAALREEAQELDEKHGGLGVYDEEVEMIANPLVVQMQELQKQLEQTNASLSTQEELDATQMAAMDKERQRILEEIKRVKEAIAAQKKNTPTASYDAPPTNPTSAQPTGTTSAQPASSERQEFVQSAPPRRKKNEF